MTRDELIAFATVYIPEIQPGPNRQFPELVVPADRIQDVARFLKAEPATRMDYLFCETAADRKDGLHVVYHLTSTAFHHCVMLKVILTDRSNPVIDTVSTIWKAAEFFEREIFDLFGIRFNGHPDMRRIFLDDDWAGYPLRKDYKDSYMLDH